MEDPPPAPPGWLTPPPGWADPPRLASWPLLAGWPPPHVMDGWGAQPLRWLSVLVENIWECTAVWSWWRMFVDWILHWSGTDLKPVYLSVTPTWSQNCCKRPSALLTCGDNSCEPRFYLQRKCIGTMKTKPNPTNGRGFSSHHYSRSNHLHFDNLIAKETSPCMHGECATHWRREPTWFRADSSCRELHWTPLFFCFWCSGSALVLTPVMVAPNFGRISATSTTINCHL